MSSPEREEVARQLAESLNFHVTRQGTWINDDQRPQSVQTLPAHVRDALISREMRVRDLEARVIELEKPAHHRCQCCEWPKGAAKRIIEARRKK